MAQQFYTLKAGDIGGIRRRGPFSWLIRWKKRKEGPEQTSHVWRVVQSGRFPAKIGEVPAMIVEALVTKGVTPPVSMTKRYGGRIDQVWVARPVNLTEVEVWDVVSWTMSQVGKRYSVGMILRHLLGSEGKIHSKFSAICSWLVAMAERVKLMKFWGLKAEMADPQDIERFIAAHENETHVWIKRPPWSP